MKIERVELLHVAIPLVSPFRTSFGTMTTKDTFLLRVVTDAAEGWSEFAADPEPLYCSEFVGAAELVLERPPRAAGDARGHGRRGRAPD